MRCGLLLLVLALCSFQPKPKKYIVWQKDTFYWCSSTLTPLTPLKPDTLHSGFGTIWIVTYPRGYKKVVRYDYFKDCE